MKSFDVTTVSQLVYEADTKTQRFDHSVEEIHADTFSIEGNGALTFWNVEEHTLRNTLVRAYAHGQWFRLEPSPPKGVTP